MSWENELDPNEKKALQAMRYADSLYRHEYGNMRECIAKASVKYSASEAAIWQWKEHVESEG